MNRLTSASQKTGMLTPISASARTRWSIGAFRFTAEITPSGTPSTTANTIAAVARRTVFGRYWARSSSTGRFETIDRPSLPWRRLSR